MQTFKSKDRFRGFEVFVKESEGGITKAQVIPFIFCVQTFKSKDRFRGFEVFVKESEGGIKKALNSQRRRLGDGRDPETSRAPTLHTLSP